MTPSEYRSHNRWVSGPRSPSPDRNKYVSGCCALVCFKPADDAWPWLSSMWVAAVPWCVSSLLTMSVLGSPVCEWLLCHDVFQACWQWLSLALQDVSGCCALVCFKPADDAYPWLFSWWVAAYLTLSKPADGAYLRSSESKLLAVFLCFMLNDETHPWLFTDHTHYCLPKCVCIFLLNLLVLPIFDYLACKCSPFVT